VLIVGPPADGRDVVAQLVADARYRGAVVDQLGTGDLGVRWTGGSWPDLVIVVPRDRAEGVAVCAALRSRSPNPILVVAPDRDEDLVVAVLDAGADDVVAQPLSRQEFTARMTAALRFRRALAEVAVPEVLELAGLRLDLTQHTVMIGECTIELPVNELRLLHALAARDGATVPADELAAELWPSESGALRNRLRVTVARLRRLLAGVPSPPVITLERGIGYALAAPPP
jgi:DNA-binding response OmpR family regulator